MDAFFPVLSVIEIETDALSILCYGMGDASHSVLYNMETVVLSDDSSGSSSDGKGAERRRWRTGICGGLFRSVVSLTLWNSFMKSLSERPWIHPIIRHLNKRRNRDGATGASVTTTATLMRMTSTRRLVTSLGRLLVGKSEVIGRIQKRLSTTRDNKRLIQNGYSNEISMYMGDVQGKVQPGRHFSSSLSV